MAVPTAWLRSIDRGDVRTTDLISPQPMSPATTPLFSPATAARINRAAFP
ncbi:unnamed protein product [Spirodela intermedia]|uniref:Uncharacterized protein n=2 Tax=Spirodela intermedia TaxID=51605 RepID=A0A7I8J0J8_SPIIN|nr:unnamed protein product [Spirodela intermedia]CAA6663333.1 unnamed protein product [Spirodela intermedia]CAA7399790.1 unnamed protein product [Spirodela intermedia]